MTVYDLEGFRTAREHTKGIKQMCKELRDLRSQTSRLRLFISKGPDQIESLTEAVDRQAGQGRWDCVTDSLLQIEEVANSMSDRIPDALCERGTHLNNVIGTLYAETYLLHAYVRKRQGNPFQPQSPELK